MTAPPSGDVNGLSDNGWCQRWARRVPAWQHHDRPGFDPARYAVVDLDERSARRFVVEHHYSGTWPAARLRYGLIDRAPHLDAYPDPDPSAVTPLGHLVGVAVLGVPMHPRVLLAPFPDLVPYAESLELARLVLLDPVPGNGETWFLARAFRRAASSGVRGIVAFSDPVPRHRHNQLIMPGHVGFTYQGHNAIYLGRGTARTLILLPDGTSLPARAAAKLTGTEPGWRGVAARLARLGAPPPAAQEPPGRWLPRALTAIGATRVRHPGNHRYAWPLHRRAARIGLPALPYPKTTALSVPVEHILAPGSRCTPGPVTRHAS